MIGPRWDWLSLSGRTSRSRYLATGVLLTAIKMGINGAVTSWVFLRPWAPTMYPLTGEIRGLFALGREDQFFYLAMLAISLPFVAVGLVLTVRRLRDAGWPLWLVALFFAPFPFNLVYLVILGLTPARPEATASPDVAWSDDLMDVPPVVKGKGRWVGSRATSEPTPRATLGRVVASILIPLPVGALVAYLLANVIGIYGWSLFVGVPFVMPMVSVILFGYHRRPTIGQCIGVGQLWLLAAVMVLLVTAFEGMICILMALPLAVPVVLLGSCLGYAVLELGPGRPRELGRMVAALLATLPLMAGAEHLEGLKPPLYECVTSVEVDAPPGAVWRRVVSFPDLAPPRDFLSRAGVAYPIRARIEGAGVGAVRLCEFSTGAFVEPIEVWDEPRLLRFAVTDCPSPMREWNPFFARVHPRHLDGFLVSERGQFRLVELPGGRTRLEGTTWYRHGLWPASYWRAWSDPILHGIHAKVLEHVKTLAEADVSRR
jgi:uncharacterized membrane protein YhaH (DUF805 family)